MLTSSAKAKGRRCAQELANELVRVAPRHIDESDIRPTPSSVPGEDLWMSPAAREVYPFSFECKNQERLNLFDAIKQTERNAKNVGAIPALAFKRNRTDMWVAIPLTAFIELVRQDYLSEEEQVETPDQSAGSNTQ